MVVGFGMGEGRVLNEGRCFVLWRGWFGGVVEGWGCMVNGGGLVCFLDFVIEVCGVREIIIIMWGFCGVYIE